MDVSATPSVSVNEDSVLMGSIPESRPGMLFGLPVPSVCVCAVVTLEVYVGWLRAASTLESVGINWRRDMADDISMVNQRSENGVDRYIFFA